MKNITKKIALALALVLAMGTMSGVTTEAAGSVKSVTITAPTKKSSYTITRKDKDVKKQLKVSVKVSGKASKAVTYKSSKPSVVSVSKTGLLTAKKAGKATITVTSKANKKKKDSVKITVKQAVTKVSASIKKPLASYNGVATLQAGKKYSMSAKVSPKSASNKKVSYKSSKSSVASVNSKGQITAKKPGTAKITVTAKDGSKQKATITVYVTKKVTKKVKSVKATADKTTLKIGETTTVKATVSPSKATCKKVAFDSSNEKVATVSATSGKVTAKAPGKTTITVKALDGSKKSTKVEITVKNNITAIAFEKAEYSCVAGDTLTVKATVNEDAYDTTVKYSVDNAAIATVDETTGVVTTKADGTATVTATAADGKTATAKIIIAKKYIPVSSLTFEKSEYTCFVGKTVTVKATTNADATNKDVTYSIDAPSQKWATVDAKTGVVTAKAKGTVAVTAKAADGKSATVNVKISYEVLTQVTPKENVEATATVTFNGDMDAIEKDIIELIQKSGLAAGSTKEITVNDIVYVAKYNDGKLTFDDNKTLADVAKGSKKVTVTVGANAKKFINGLAMASFTSGTYTYDVTIGTLKFTNLQLGTPHIKVTVDGTVYDCYGENGSLYFVGDVAEKLSAIANVAEIKVVR